MKSKYHKTKSGKMAKKGLYYNINKRKEAGTSRPKSNLLYLRNLIRVYYQDLKTNYKDSLIVL
jgi:hypothetical protein